MNYSEREDISNLKLMALSDRELVNVLTSRARLTHEVIEMLIAQADNEQVKEALAFVQRAMKDQLNGHEMEQLITYRESEPPCHAF